MNQIKLNKINNTKIKLLIIWCITGTIFFFGGVMDKNGINHNDLLTWIIGGIFGLLICLYWDSY